MENFILTNQNELLLTLATIVVILLLKFIGNKTVKRIGRVSHIVEARILLITKYVSILLTFFGIGALAFIWGVNFRELGLLFSSIFAVVGIALFASWSILSNVTSGVILFFFFPFKIGDRVKVMDKEIIDGTDKGYGVFVIENIKSFHVLLRNSEGELLTYPNNMMLQKGVTLIKTHQELKKKSEIL
jgi:small-conductance mechanosensitive channel